MAVLLGRRFLLFVLFLLGIHGPFGNPLGNGCVWTTFDLDLTRVVTAAEDSAVEFRVLASFAVLLLQSCESVSDLQSRLRFLAARAKISPLR